MSESSLKLLNSSPGFKLNPNLPLPTTLMSARAMPRSETSPSLKLSQLLGLVSKTNGATSSRKHGPSNCSLLLAPSKSRNSSEVIGEDARRVKHFCLGRQQ